MRFSGLRPWKDHPVIWRYSGNRSLLFPVISTEQSSRSCRWTFRSFTAMTSFQQRCSHAAARASTYIHVCYDFQFWFPSLPFAILQFAKLATVRWLNDTVWWPCVSTSLVVLFRAFRGMHRITRTHRNSWWMVRLQFLVLWIGNRVDAVSQWMIFWSMMSIQSNYKHNY
jgi:hypothetical protein